MSPVPDLSGTAIRAALVDQFVVATYGGSGSKTLVRGISTSPAGIVFHQPGASSPHA